MKKEVSCDKISLDLMSSSFNDGIYTGHTTTSGLHLGPKGAFAPPPLSKFFPTLPISNQSSKCLLMLNVCLKCTRNDLRESKIKLFLRSMPYITLVDHAYTNGQASPPLFWQIPVLSPTPPPGNKMYRKWPIARMLFRALYK